MHPSDATFCLCVFCGDMFVVFAMFFIPANWFSFVLLNVVLRVLVFEKTGPRPSDKPLRDLVKEMAQSASIYLRLSNAAGADGDESKGKLLHMHHPHACFLLLVFCLFLFLFLFNFFLKNLLRRYLRANHSCMGHTAASRAQRPSSQRRRSHKGDSCHRTRCECG